MSDATLNWWGITSNRLFFQLSAGGAGSHLVIPGRPLLHILLLGFSMTASKNTRVRGLADETPVTAWFNLQKGVPWQRDSFWGIMTWPEGASMKIQNEKNTGLSGIFVAAFSRESYIGSLI